MKISPLLLLKAFTLIVVGFITFSISASAQMMPLNPSNEKLTSGLEVLLDDARKDGSTVIIVQPTKKDTKVVAPSFFEPKEFLKTRIRLSNIIASAPELLPSLTATLQAAGQGNSYIWILQGFATALIGVFIGWLLVKPIESRVNVFVQTQYVRAPHTTADKATYLLLRASMAVVYSIMIFVAALLVALIFDTGDPAARRLFFETVMAYVVYRILRYGISWNLLAFDVPQYRLVNLNDDEATRLHRHWWIASIAIVVATGCTRFFVMTGFNSGNGDFTGNGQLKLLNSQFLYISMAAFVILILALFTIKNWKSMQHVLAPTEPMLPMFRLRVALARLVPIALLTYGLLAFAMFVYRVAALKPGAGSLIAGPFVIGYLSVGIFGLVLIGIQAFYNRRVRRFELLASQEREQRAEEEMNAIDSNLDVDAGEEMTQNADGDIFEYKPLFREFFEYAAMAIIIILAVGQLAKVWGVPLEGEGNVWSATLDIILATTICWIAYSAVRIFIDFKIAEEGGVPEDGEQEMGGEGGGAGATRLATLLPIMRYVLLTIIFSVAAVVILSKMNIDIGPIFAGAGVVGIAVGFGAQTLIRDIFSGAFFLMDDAFRKGEYVEIEGIKGVVEKISIRSFQLRHHLGALHTIPFGEIKQLTNYSRDWVMMKLPLRVTYDTDVEKVRKLVKKLGQALLEHPVVGPTFMQPLKSQGVYKMEDSAMIIRVKFMTKPGEQFVTRKVVYESIQDLFAREGIHFAHKEVTVRLADSQVEDLSEEEKQAVSSAARSVIDSEESAALAAAGGKVSGSDR